MKEDVLCIFRKDFNDKCPYCRSKNVDERMTSGAPAAVSVKLSAVYDTGMRFCFDCRRIFLSIDCGAGVRPLTEELG